MTPAITVVAMALRSNIGRTGALTAWPFNSSSPASRPLSTLEWLGILLLCYMPVLNFIALLAWAFGASKRPSLRTFARAQLAFFALLLGATAIVLALVAQSGVLNDLL